MSALLLLGKYQLAERLGPQGAIETHGALMKVNGEQRPCIVKWLRADGISDESYRSLAARFLAAGQRLLDRHDPGWPVVFDVTQNEQGTFLIREFVAGVDLNGLLQAAREKDPAATLAPAVASLVASKLAQVLTKAHQSEPPLFHLGLAPANVLVTPDGRVVVADFGLFASVRGLVEHGLERWSFVAPELIGCDVEDVPPPVGVAADLYSLWGLLFYLLSGRPPVQARSLTELAERVWDPLPTLPGVPEQLNAAMAALTSPDPQNRCKSAQEVVSLLTPQGGAPGRAHNPPAVNPQELPQTKGSSLPFYPALPPSPARQAPRKATSKRVRPRSSRLLVAAMGVLLLVGGATALRTYSVHVRRSDAPASGINQSPEMRPTSPGAKGSQDPPPAISARRRKELLVPGHLNLDTSPTNADLWVDGIWQGKTPMDVIPGPGVHRVVVVAAGHLMFSEIYDTTEGEVIRRTLEPIPPPTHGSAYLDIECHSEGKFPVLIDHVETGLICPARMVPVASGRRKIAIFVPILQNSVEQDVTVPAAARPMAVRFAQ